MKQILYFCFNISYKLIFLLINNMIKENSRDSKTIEIEKQSIGLPAFKNNNQDPLKHQQSRKANKQNDILKKQLETISVRLDSEIKKRLDKSRRPWSKNSDQGSYLQLQNAYKKCEIYKRQANFFRKRLSTFEDETKHQQNGIKMHEYIKQNSQLKNEIKSLNKLIKSQQKVIVLIGSQDYSKIIKDNQRLKEENRRLKKSLSEYRLSCLNLKQRNDGSDEGSSRIKAKEQNDKDDSEHEKLQKSYMKIKSLIKYNSHLRDIIENYQYQMQQKQKQINTYRQKINNLRKNNEQLWSEVSNKRNNKKYSIPANIDLQQVQPHKQQVYSRAKILKTEANKPEVRGKDQSGPLSNRKIKSTAGLKKKPQISSSLSNNRPQSKKIQKFINKTQDNKLLIPNKVQKSNKETQSNEKQIEIQREKVSRQKNRVWKLGQNQIQSQQNRKKQKQIDINGKKSQPEEQLGQQNHSKLNEQQIQLSSIQGTKSKPIKWNDQAFNSKIKQIEIIMDQNQVIKDIHVRYLKGGPKKYSPLNEKYKSSVLTCSQLEYITVISGIFQHGYLQFLSLTTSNKRTQHFGKKFLQDKEGGIQPFQFQVEDGQFIGALHGQKNEEGIIKIGYAVLKE